MKSSLSALPFMAVALLLAALLLLDLAFDAAPEVLLAFVPALVWLGIIVARGRG